MTTVEKTAAYPRESWRASPAMGLIVARHHDFRRSEPNGHKFAGLRASNRSTINRREKNMKTRTILILSILSSGLILAGPIAHAKKHGGDGGEADDHRRKALQFVDAKQFDKAIEEFNKEVQAAPGEPEAYRDRGNAYRAAGRAAA